MRLGNCRAMREWKERVFQGGEDGLGIGKGARVGYGGQRPWTAGLWWVGHVG